VPPPKADELEALPDTWAWAAVSEIGEVQLGGTPSRKEASYWDGDVPWVSSGEVANCRISNTRETITEAGLANSSAKLYPAGTVLIAMIGEGKTRGQSAILDIEASTNQNAAGVLPDREIVNPEYVWRWALAQYEVTRAVGRGGNQPALNGQKVRELTIPLPPLEEQCEIIRRVDQLLALADSLKQRIEIASKLVERSSQAVLTKAFRGELSEPTLLSASRSN
jgi:type I restriction enzyme S subunit